MSTPQWLDLEAGVRCRIAPAFSGPRLDGDAWAAFFAALPSFLAAPSSTLLASGRHTLHIIPFPADMLGTALSDGAPLPPLVVTRTAKWCRSKVNL